MQILDPKTGSRLVFDLPTARGGALVSTEKMVPDIPNNLCVLAVANDSVLRNRNGVLSWSSGNAGKSKNHPSLHHHSYCLRHYRKSSGNHPR